MYPFYIIEILAISGLKRLKRLMQCLLFRYPPRVHYAYAAIGTRRDKNGLCCCRSAHNRDHQRAQPVLKVSKMPGMMVWLQKLAE